MKKLTDNDKNWGPFTLARWNKRMGLMLCSGDEEEGAAKCHFLLNLFGWALRIRIPNIVPPLRIKQMALSWDEETVRRLGRNWYYQTHEREFGAVISDMGNGYDFLQVHFGAQTHDSRTTKSWCKHLPWKQWRCVRNSVYNPDGSHFESENKKADWGDWYDVREKCPTTHFGFEDYDGEMIVATCRIEEMEWHKGEGWFKWLGYFTSPKVRRSLDIRFSAEVGPEKGSWKGGTLGHGIDMLSGEAPEAAFRRYCAKDHERKGRKFSLQFIGPCAPPPKKPQVAEAASNPENPVNPVQTQNKNEKATP